MATEALISWNTPEHFHTDKSSDWYWTVGIIALALTVVAIILGQIIPAIFIIVAVVALVLHAAHPPRSIYCEINDRGIVVDKTLYPFLSLDSFWIPHDEFPPKIILKSHKLFMPFIVILIDEVDPEEVRAVLLNYIAETEHHQSILKHLLERAGF